MFADHSTLLTALLALAAIFLGLSLFVQVVQEIYKHLSSSKDKSYRMMLIDFLGPWAHQLYEPATHVDLQVRGPFQILRRRPSARLLPMDAATLVNSLERTIPDWHRRALEAIRLETELQAGTAQEPSPPWKSFLAELAGIDPESSGYWSAYDVAEFLTDWGHVAGDTDRDELKAPERLDAARLLTAFRSHFTTDIERVERDFSQFQRNFDFAYRRRNLRQTFVLGLLIAVVFNLPFDRLYRRATSLSSAEAIDLVERASALYARQTDTDVVADTTAVLDTTATVDLLERSRAILDTVLIREAQRGRLQVGGHIATLGGRGFSGVASYVFWCVITALLVSFGAPFWNDLAGALLQMQRRSIDHRSSTEGGSHGQ